LVVDIHDDLYKRLSSDNPLLFDLWIPTSRVIVIGYSQRAEQEVYVGRCRRDGLPVAKRRGGGGAVLLMPGTLCITCAFFSTLSESPHYYFKCINRFLCDFLTESYHIRDLSLHGISDIAIGDKKILGCSIFKSRTTVFYQGSLLVNPDLEAVGYYLRHPSREPDYRRGRRHVDFLTSLERCGYQISPTDLRGRLLPEMEKRFESAVR
jgi:lipoate-protein ligase A